MRLGFAEVVGLIAEILRAVVMGDVVDMGCGGGRIGGLVIIAFLEPTPIYRLVMVAGDLLDVLLNISRSKAGSKSAAVMLSIWSPIKESGRVAKVRLDAGVELGAFPLQWADCALGGVSRARAEPQ